MTPTPVGTACGGVRPEKGSRELMGLATSFFGTMIGQPSDLGHVDLGIGGNAVETQ